VREQNACPRQEWGRHPVSQKQGEERKKRVRDCLVTFGRRTEGGISSKLGTIGFIRDKLSENGWYKPSTWGGGVVKWGRRIKKKKSGLTTRNEKREDGVLYILLKRKVAS